MTDTELFQAIQAGDAADVAQLVGARPDLLTAVSPSGLSPVLFAAYYRQPHIARLLVERGAPLSAFEAAAAGELKRLAGTLDANPALLHAHSPDGFGLLDLAAFFGHLDLARDLLARGAEVNTPSTNRMGVAPLHSAVAGDHTELALALLTAGADVNARQHGGFTPLMGAAQNGNRTLVEALLRAGADPGAANDDGQRAPDLAEEEGHAEVAARLRQGI